MEGGGETPPIFLSRSKIFLVNEKSVHDIAWIVRIQVGPTSDCFRQKVGPSRQLKTVLHFDCRKCFEIHCRPF